MDGGVENCDVSSRNGSIKSHNFYQLNGLKSLMTYNDMGDMDINYDLHYRYVSSGIGLITPPPPLLCKK